MTKLAKYLKPFVFGLLASFALLFIQAMCDLNLPNYMSDIVNIGIQQSGVEHAAPDALSEKGMKLIQTFMSDDERALTEKSYRLAAGSDTGENGKRYDSLYPKAADGKLYVKTESSDGLDAAFGLSTWTFIKTMQKMNDQQGGQSGGALQTDVGSIDFQKLYDMQPMLDMIPRATIDEARNEAASMSDLLLKQSGMALSKGFLTELGADVGAKQSGYILRTGFLMLVIALIGGASTVFVSLLSSRIAAGTARNLRSDLFNKVSSFSSAEFDQFSTASLITRSTNDITQIQMLIAMGIRMLCYAPIMAIGGMIMALRKSLSMAWVIGLAVALMILLVLVIFFIAMPRFKLIQKLIDRLNLVSRESLSGLMVIRAFGTSKHEEARFDEANRDLTKVMLFVNRVMAFMMPAIMLVMNGITVLIVWVGAHQIADSSMQVGDMMAFLQYAMQVIMSFLFIAMMFIMVPRAAVSAGRIAEVLESKPSIIDPPSPRAFARDKKGLVEFRDVSFRYGGAEEDALDHISFTARPGETTAIIGPTGSGKSTIANLLLRFYDVTGGQILVDGVDLREASQHDLRERVGYVPQKSALLSGTVSSNLRYGKPDASDEEVAAAAAVAQAQNIIDEKADGYLSEVAQGGQNFSGGQKQRFSIARALVKKPEIYLFDDSFSALDFKTDVALRKALKPYTSDATVILVAQRVGTIMDADQILVLDEGRVVGRGTHRELLASCPAYYEIASSQLSKEELQ